MRKIIGVDVDLTVVDVVTEWVKWYKDITGHELNEISRENNNIQDIMTQHDDPMKYWRKEDLYDNASPYPEAIKYLTKLSKDFDIIFISACLPEHETSKKHFLKRNFKFMKGFISTENKNFVRCDYFIDDNKKYCRQLLPYAKVFQIKSFLNSCSNEFPYLTWEEIYNSISSDKNSDKI